MNHHLERMLVELAEFIASDPNITSWQIKMFVSGWMSNNNCEFRKVIKTNVFETTNQLKE